MASMKLFIRLLNRLLHEIRRIGRRLSDEAVQLVDQVIFGLLWFAAFVVLRKGLVLPIATDGNAKQFFHELWLQDLQHIGRRRSRLVYATSRIPDALSITVTYGVVRHVQGWLNLFSWWGGEAVVKCIREDDPIHRKIRKS